MGAFTILSVKNLNPRYFVEADPSSTEQNGNLQHQST